MWLKEIQNLDSESIPLRPSLFPCLLYSLQGADCHSKYSSPIISLRIKGRSCRCVCGEDVYGMDTLKDTVMTPASFGPCVCSCV